MKGAGQAQRPGRWAVFMVSRDARRAQGRGPTGAGCAGGLDPAYLRSLGLSKHGSVTRMVGEVGRHPEGPHAAGQTVTIRDGPPEVLTRAGSRHAGAHRPGHWRLGVLRRRSRRPAVSNEQE